MNFTIDKMKEAHRDAVMDMMRDFYNSDAVLSNGSDEIFTRDIDVCAGDSPFAEGYVFTECGEAVGYAMLAKSHSMEFGRPCIWIEDLYIKPSHRGRGIGTEFFNMIFASYPECVLRLEVEPENAGAAALYEKCGFEVIPYSEMIRKERGIEQ